MSQKPQILGTEEDDYLQGTAIAEEIFGFDGDDVIDAGGGDDELDGGAGADVLIGGAGDDVYNVDELDMVFEAEGEGEDEVRTSAAAYALGDYLERLTGQSLDAQELTGNALDNVVLGGSAGDVIRGGLGDDYLAGRGGSDLYRFSRGDGDDQIFVEVGPERDSLMFDFDIFPWEVTVTQSGYDIVITLDQGSGSVTLLGSGTAFTNLGDVTFGDGSTLSGEDLLTLSMLGTEGADSIRGDSRDNLLTGLGGDDVLDGGGGIDEIVGGDGDDMVTGGSGDDLIEGGTGNDVLSGGEGNDVFRFGAGFAEDVIVEADGPTTGGYDRIEFLGSIVPGDVTVTIDGNDVLISITGTTDRIRLQDMLINAANTVELLAFADGTLLNLLYLVGPVFHEGTEGDDILQGSTLLDVMEGNGGDDILNGGAGADRLDGGLGNDQLNGGSGTDLYLFRAGSGHDVITEDGMLGDMALDRVIVSNLGERWDAVVGLSSDGLSHILYFNGGEDSLTLYGSATGDIRYRVEMIQFGWSNLSASSLPGLVQNLSNGDDVVTGTASWDTLRGLGGNDVIDGGGEGDSLKGDAGDDTLVGGEGNDLLDGGAGADLLIGGTGDDDYVVADSSDTIVEAADEGYDEVSTTAAVYILADNVESIHGYATGGQTLTGNASDNYIWAGSGDDTLEGAAGDDQLQGNAGSDTYRFARGDGDDVILEHYWVTGLEESGLNVIQFALDILPDDVAVTISGQDLVLTVDEAGGSITIAYGLMGTNLAEVRFGDGTVWSYAELLARPFTGGEGTDVLTGDDGNNVLLGNGGDDVLTGGYGDDVLDGGAGMDRLTGNSGNDVFRFGRGFGQDTIVDAYNLGDGYDRIEFIDDILPSEVEILSMNGGKILLIGIAGTTDRIRLDVSPYWPGLFTEEVAFSDGTVWTADMLLAMAVPLADPATELLGTESDDVLTGGGSDEILRGEGGDDSLSGGDGSDWMYGGAGADLLVGGAGGDHYFFGPGEGNDVFRENDGAADGAVDTIWFSGLYSWQSTVTLSDDGLSYVLLFGAGEQSLTLEGAAGGDPRYQFEILRFEDGILLAADLALWVVDYGNGDDVLTGHEYSDTLRGLGGNDLIDGGGDRDWLKGDGGDDILIGGEGDDEMDGGSGADYLIGGTGDDVYVIGDPDDSIIENADEGEDQVRTSVAAFVLPDHVEKLTGESADLQELTGNSLDNVIEAAHGGSVLKGGLGDDHLVTGYGSDIYLFSRGDGDDVVQVQYGQGQDTLLFDFDIFPWEVAVTQVDGNIVLTLDQGSGSVTLLTHPHYGFNLLPEVTFGDGTTWSREDLLTYSLVATEGADVRTGDVQANSILGLGGDDWLDGGQGDDSLDGGDGNDVLIGGQEADQLTGGAGADVFLYRLNDLIPGWPADHISDFVSGEDVIDLSAARVDWTYPFTSTVDAFTFIGSAAFSGAVGELRFVFDGVDTRIQIDGRGDGYATTEILLHGNVILAASDFVL